jgi:hypothetical protein
MGLASAPQTLYLVKQIIHPLYDLYKIAKKIEKAIPLVSIDLYDKLG